MTYIFSPNVPIEKVSVAAVSTVVISKAHTILQLVIQNNTANALLGGLKIGTTVGGNDVLTSISIGSKELRVVHDSEFFKSIFSMTSKTTLYIDCVIGWNSANLNLYFMLREILN